MTDRGAVQHLAGPDIAWHIPELGQSLGLGLDLSGKVLTPHSPIPGKIKMFNGGMRPICAQGVMPTKSQTEVRLDPQSLSGLIEAAETSSGTRFHETHMMAMATGLYKATGIDPAEITVSGHGLGGTPWVFLGKGQAAYDNMMDAVRAHVRLARQAGLRPVVPFVTMIHGEADKPFGGDVYRGYLRDHLAHIQTDIPALTGQAVPPFLVISQAAVRDKKQVSDVATAQLDAALDHPDLVCIGPKYAWTFSDGLHLTSDSYRIMGEQIAKFAALKLAGRPALPLHLQRVDRLGPKRLRLGFHVPVGPLQVGEADGVTDPGAAGIEVFHRRRVRWVQVPVTRVALAGAETIDVTVARTVVGADVQVRVAMQRTERQGPDCGPRSLLRDSDPVTGPLSGAPLTNWCAHGSCTLVADG